MSVFSAFRGEALMEEFDEHGLGFTVKTRPVTLLYTVQHSGNHMLLNYQALSAAKIGREV